MTGERIPTPFLVTGPDGRPIAVLLPRRVCAVLQARLGHELAALRVQTRGVDQDTSSALRALAEAAYSGVPRVPALVDETSEHASRSEVLSTAMAADLLGVGSRAVIQAIGRGRLSATKEGRVWRLDRKDVENYKVARAA